MSQGVQRVGKAHTTPGGGRRGEKGGEVLLWLLPTTHAQDLAASVLPACLLVVQDTHASGEHNVPELARRKQVVHLLFNVPHCQVKAGAHHATLVNTTNQAHHNLPRPVVVHYLKVTNVAWGGRGGGRWGGGSGGELVGGGGCVLGGAPFLPLPFNSPCFCISSRKRIMTLEEGLMRTWRLPRFSALYMAFKASARTCRRRVGEGEGCGEGKKGPRLGCLDHKTVYGGETRTEIFIAG